MNIYSASQIRDWDRFTIENEPISSLELMERAARLIADELLRNADYSFRPFYFFCGNGNNGGDGLAAARMLQEAGRQIEIFMLQAETYSQDFLLNLERLQDRGISVNEIAGAEEFPLMPKDVIVVDALFGTGLSRPLEGLAAMLVSHLNSHDNVVISIDLPSGLFADNSSVGNIIVKASVTLSFQAPKLAFILAENAGFVGNWKLLDIRLSPNYISLTPAAFEYLEIGQVRNIIKPRNKFSHKYNYGHALLFAGSPGMYGAGILCAKACTKSGVGLVTMAVEEAWASVYQIAVPEMLCEFDWERETLLHKKTAIGIGPGWKHDGTYFAQTQMALVQTTVAVVADATAIQWFSGETKAAKPAPGTIITPHTGEFDKAFGKTTNDFERMQLALDKSLELQIYIVLKGAHTFIATPSGKGYFNSTGNAGMAKGGSGDVLTGILTGLLAQGYNQVDTCILGVFMHGLAGDLAAARHTMLAMTALDIVEQMGAAWHKLTGSL